jgi:hypothetical protein
MKVREKMLTMHSVADANLVAIPLKRNLRYEFAWIAIIIRT